MKVITDLTKVQFPKTAVTFGKFDGVHLGHQTLISRVRNQKTVGYAPTVFTFAAPPRVLFAAEEEKEEAGRMLLTKKEQHQRFEQLGIEYVIEYPFHEKNRQMSAEQFVRDVIHHQLHASYLAVGEDFRFGYQRRGDVTLLQQMAAEYHYQLEVVRKEADKNGILSSSRIRSLLEAGQVEEAERCLGEPYHVTAEIVTGNRLGRTWNIPTINMEWPQEKIRVCHGVYFSKVLIDGNIYNGMTNVGHKPTIGEGYALGLETYLYDCDQDLYGKEATVCLLHFERPEQKFGSFDALIGQIRQDIEKGSAFFKKDEKSVE